MEIYCVVEYAYNTYSYSGLEEYNREYFQVKEAALQYIKNNNLILKEYPKYDNECTLEVIQVN